MPQCTDMSKTDSFLKIINSYTVRKENAVSLLYNHKTKEIFEIDNTSARLIKELQNVGISEVISQYSCNFEELNNFSKQLGNELISGSKSLEQTKKNLYDFQANNIQYSSPLFVYWEFINRCNLKCIHCFESATLYSSLQPLDHLLRCVSEFKKNKVFEIILAGGEPFLYPQLPQLIDAIYKSNISIPVIATNGTCMKDDFLENIAGKVEKIQVSIDGHNKEIHERFRGVKGCFGKALEGIAKVQKYSIPVQISYTINQFNVDYTKEFLDYCNQLKVNSVKIGSIMPTGEAAKNHLLPFTPFKYWELSEFINNYKSKVNYEIISNFNFSFIYNNNSPVRRKSKGCGAGNELVAVDFEGNVYPCSYAKLPVFFMGNLHKTSLERIYNNRSTPFQQLHKINNTCIKCDYYQELCSGGCRVLSYLMKNDFFDIDPLCPLYN